MTDRALALLKEDLSLFKQQADRLWDARCAVEDAWIEAKKEADALADQIKQEEARRLWLAQLDQVRTGTPHATQES